VLNSWTLYVGELVLHSNPTLSFMCVMCVIRPSPRKTNSHGITDRIQEKSLTSVIYVADVSLTVVTYQNIVEYILVTSDFCVNFAVRVFIDMVIS